MKTSPLSGRNILRLSYLMVFLFWRVDTISGTFLVSVSSDDVLVIGSDGIMTRPNIAGRLVGKEPSCKIRQVGNQVVAHAGLTFERPVQFEFWETVSSISADSTSEFVSRLSGILDEKLQEVARARRERNPPHPDYRLTIIELYIAGWEPELTLFELVARIPSDGVPVTKYNRLWPMWDEIPANYKPGRVRLMNYFGSYNASILSAREPIEVLTDPVKYGRSKIQAQIDAGNQSVGPPITIVSIDKSGPKWIEVGSCDKQVETQN